jgi:hypothetical protein
MDENIMKFEQGPIRPPNEAQSLLLRFTRNCPWNHCLFCPVYKGRKFSLRTIEEIKGDIDTAGKMVDDIEALSKKLGADGRVDGQVMAHILHRSQYSTSYRSVAGWMHYGTDACFLQDADNLIMKTDDLVEVLTYLKQRLPRINRVTTYTRSRTVNKKSVESLRQICKAGLDRIHIGLETGHDPLLKLVKKGVTADGHIDAGRRVIGAGMELSEYVMPGLGGQEMWKAHAEDTARVLNEINPHFIRLRSLRVPKRVPLYEKLEAGTFTMQTDDMLAEELRVFISALDGITSTVTSDHMMNLLEEVSGRFPEDKEKMLAVIEDYQALSDIDRLVYRTGRRGGTYRSTRDLTSDPATYRKIRNLIEQVQSENGEEGVETFISEMVDRYI